MSVFSKDGNLIKRFGDFGEAKNAKGNLFSEPYGAAVNGNGNIFICDRYNFRIQEFNSNREFVKFWLTSGSFDDSKHFPIGLSTSRDSTLFITDHFSHCIQKYSLTR